MIKSLIRPLAIVLCLASIACWLFVKSRQDGHQQYDEFSQLLTMISRLDAEINAEVLKLKFRLHRDYDRLTMLEESFADCHRELDKFGEFAFLGDAHEKDSLTRASHRKLQLVKDFKALHAVLENSVLMFHRSGDQLQQLLQDHTQFKDVHSALLAFQKSGIELVLNVQPSASMELRIGIETLGAIPFDSIEQASRLRDVMLAHARNILNSKPQMDDLLSEMSQPAVPLSLQAMHENGNQVLAKNSRYASNFQLQLLGATLLLIAYCGYAIYRIGLYVKTIRFANEKLEDRVRARTRELEAKSEVLRSNGRFLSSVLDAIDARICILDMDGTINAANAAWLAQAEKTSCPKSGSNYLSQFSENVRTEFGATEVIETINRLKSSDSLSAVVEYSTTTEPLMWIQARTSKMMPRGQDRFLGYVVALIDITDRYQAQAEKDKLNRQLQLLSRQAGMAEVATGVLHNVGNVLNSINVSSSQAARIVRSSRLASLQKAEQLIQQHLDDFAGFVADDPRGQQLPKYITQIARTWEEEQAQVLNELAELARHVDHVKHVIHVQQEHAKVTKIVQEVQLSIVLEDAISTIMPNLKSAKIELLREFDQLPAIQSDAHKIMQILLNLLSNAKHAVLDSKTVEPRIVFRAHATADQNVVLSVSDNGVGISSEHLAKICQHGFTTKKNGHGFGLHSCALLAKELGGELVFSSPGVNQGATFALHLPLCTTTESLDQELVHVPSH